MASNFVHLHNHTEFSILDGALNIDELLDAAVNQGMPAVAVTDHGNIFGAVQFFQKAKDRGIKPILGCEVYVAPRDHREKKAGPNGVNHYHLVLLVKNEEGYKNLCRLITRSYLDGFYYRPRVDKKLLAQHSRGLIALSGCLKGEVSDHLVHDQNTLAEEAARDYREIFAEGDFFIELQDHGLEPQQRINPHLIQLARKMDLPLIVTNDVHYLEKNDAESHDVLLCIQTNKKVRDKDRIRFGSQEFYFKTAEEMEEKFHNVPDALRNSLDIASRCEFDLSASQYFLPHFEPPGRLPVSTYFQQVVEEGFRRKMKILEPRINRGELPSPGEYQARLEREIKLVREMEFEGYFLIVWDIIREARARGIPVGPGRGSAAGSLLAFSLGITALDPLEYDLLFERFLNPERISLPDIDIDFCGRRRDEVISYVKEKFGQDNVCQIITFGTMAARQAVRDVGRALEIPLPEVDKAAKMIPAMGEDSTIAAASQKIPQLKAWAEEKPKIKELLSVAQRLEGQVRHPSTHAAGIVITPRPLVEFVPLYQSTRHEVTTQFPMQDVESIGLLKMDILGLRNLTVIQDTVNQVKKDTGQNIDLEAVPLDDEKTFAVFQKGNTDGVFQFESSGMKDLLRRYRPENFRDLIALNALYRPGPLQSGMTEDFIKRKSNPQMIKYDLPELEPILRETNGLIVYQEQVMRIATDIADFSLAEADLLRKAMGKKKKSVMKSMKKRFMTRAQNKGFSKLDAQKIFEKIDYFAGYGFNKSHSAAYAYLAFQTAYLKAHFPLHYMAALMTSEAERGVTSQVVKYINECREMGIPVLPPDINASGLNFQVDGGAIRFGMAAVKNLGEGPVREIIKVRERKGKFSSPFDICREIEPKSFNRKVIESLIKAGALDSLGWKRSHLYQCLDLMIEYTHDFSKIRNSGQATLFGSGHMKPPEVPPEIENMPEWEKSELLSFEKEALGFYFTGHPLAQFKKQIRNLVSHSISELDAGAPVQGEVKLAGIVMSVRSLKTRRDERMATFVLEDMNGRAEVVAFPDSYQKYYDIITEDNLVFLIGQVQGEADPPRIIMSAVYPLNAALERLAKRLFLRIHLPGLEKEVYSKLKSVLEENPGDCPVIFALESGNGYRVTVQSVEIQAVKPSRELTRRLEDLLGEKCVHVEY
ncbi:MAG: DNA polymerase III subunit alpha [Candidatus Aminicenantes bacterium]